MKNEDRLYFKDEVYFVYLRLEKVQEYSQAANIF